MIVVLDIGLYPYNTYTAFVCDSGVFEFNRAPFGLKSSGCSFVRAIGDILQPVRCFSDAFVDDVAVHSDKWTEHMTL